MPLSELLTDEGCDDDDDGDDSADDILLTRYFFSSVVPLFKILFEFTYNFATNDSAKFTHKFAKATNLI